MRKILLVSPDIHAKSVSTYTPYTSNLHKKSVVTVPLQLATVAALTPDGYKVQIWDEAVQGAISDDTDLGDDYDLVGVTAYYNHLSRARELGDVFRRRGIVSVIGGAGVSSEPESMRKHFDVLFLGEAELTWPQFLADFERGVYEVQYGPSGFPDLNLSPKPRWDSIAHLLEPNYRSGGVQVNRGCPFNCEFCSSWQMFGRKMRNKPIDQVLEEVKKLEELGMENILICTENFVGDPRYAKDLLRELIKLKESFRREVRYFTELTITISHDEEMLKLLAEANFVRLLIGIESPKVESLKETRKRMNLRTGFDRGLVGQCLKIMSYGMVIQGSMIVGFDHDNLDIFDQQFEFLQASCIPTPKLNTLKAVKGTDLYERLLKEGRLVDMKKDGLEIPDDRFLTNIVPKNMTRMELYTGYVDLWERIWDWKNFEKRMMGFIDNLNYRGEVSIVKDELSIIKDKERLFAIGGLGGEVISNILSYTERYAAPMIWDVIALVKVQCQENAHLPALRKSLDMMKVGEECLKR